MYYVTVWRDWSPQGCSERSGRRSQEVGEAWSGRERHGIIIFAIMGRVKVAVIIMTYNIYSTLIWH